jgi:hypothetical protein
MSGAGGYSPVPVLYSERLLGLRDDCEIGGCRQEEGSTGWLLSYLDDDRWYVEFECPIHGRGGAWRPEWQPLIDEVVNLKTEAGFDTPAALQALRERSQGEGRP